MCARHRRIIHGRPSASASFAIAQGKHERWQPTSRSPPWPRHPSQARFAVVPSRARLAPSSALPMHIWVEERERCIFAFPLTFQCKIRSLFGCPFGERCWYPKQYSGPKFGFGSHYRRQSKGLNYDFEIFVVSSSSVLRQCGPLDRCDVLLYGSIIYIISLSLML